MNSLDPFVGVNQWPKLNSISSFDYYSVEVIEKAKFMSIIEATSDCKLVDAVSMW
jgi:hypothetical protein